MSLKERFTYTPHTDLLGRGGFSTVYKAFDKQQNKFVALKFFNNEANKKYSIREELKKITPLTHPNIVRYMDLITHKVQNIHGDEESVEVGVLEYINGGDLKEFLKKNPGTPQHVLTKILTDILAGLSYLHYNKIVHRDLNPKNILISTDGGSVTAKITDFGISKDIDASQSSSSNLLGTINYMAPEQFEPRAYGINGKIGTNLDLWSFGAMTFELFTGRPLFGSGFGGTKIQETMKSILMDPLPAEVRSLPHPFNLLVERCLIRNAGSRIQSADEALQLLSNPAAFEIRRDPPPPRVEPKLTGNETVLIPKMRTTGSNPVNQAQQQTIEINVAPDKKKKKRRALVAIFLALFAIAGAIGITTAFGSGEADPVAKIIPADTISANDSTLVITTMDAPADSLPVTPSEPKTDPNAIRFNELVSQGKRAFDNGDLNDARNYYTEALGIYPNSSNCQNKINEIDQQLGEKARENRFVQYMADARVDYSNGDYESARTNYRSALTIYSDNAEATNKIAEINAILKKKNCKKCGGSGTYTVTETCPNRCDHGTITKVCPVSNCYSGDISCSSCGGDGDKDCSNCSGGVVSCGSCGGDGKFSCNLFQYYTCSSCGGSKGYWYFNGYSNVWQNCIGCGGTGQVLGACSQCGGNGFVYCNSCGGDGDKSCSSCGGDGEKSCGSCGGDGKNSCSRCGGDGKINSTCSSCTGGTISKKYSCSHD
jgi:serine/threonine protein kinase